MRNFNLRSFRLTRFLNSKKENEIRIFLEIVLDFPLLKKKHNESNVAEEYCWAITQAIGWACCGRSGSRVLENGFQLDVLEYKYTCI